jgi:uncharacterized protein (DUF2132 family)
MTEQQNNPLHGLKMETMVTELVEFYGWEILATAMRFHCFKSHPTIKGTVKFIRSTEWAREKLENFYLYKFKRMPKPTDEEFGMSPRERGFRDGLDAKKPMQLTKESIELSQAKSASAHKARSSEKFQAQNKKHFREELRDQGRSQVRSDLDLKIDLVQYHDAMDPLLKEEIENNSIAL